MTMTATKRTRSAKNLRTQKKRICVHTTHVYIVHTHVCRHVRKCVLHRCMNRRLDTCLDTRRCKGPHTCLCSCLYAWLYTWLNAHLHKTHICAHARTDSYANAHAHLHAATHMFFCACRHRCAYTCAYTHSDQERTLQIFIDTVSTCFRRVGTWNKCTGRQTSELGMCLEMCSDMCSDKCLDVSTHRAMSRCSTAWCSAWSGDGCRRGDGGMAQTI